MGLCIAINALMKYNRYTKHKYGTIRRTVSDTKFGTVCPHKMRIITNWSKTSVTIRKKRLRAKSWCNYAFNVKETMKFGVDRFKGNGRSRRYMVEQSIK